MIEQALRQIFSTTVEQKTRVVAQFPDMVTALAVLLIGWQIISLLVTFLRNLFIRIGVEEALGKFLMSSIDVVARIVLIINAASIAGFYNTSLAAILAAMGLALALSLQGGLSNFVGGLVILTFRPFNINDYITALGVEGRVQKIEMFSTTLHTSDNQKVVLPNGKLANEVVTNRTARPTRRIELKLKVSHDADIEEVRKELIAIAKANDHILRDPAPAMIVTALVPEGIELELRVWVRTEELTLIKSDMYVEVKKRFVTDKLVLAKK